MKLEPSEHTLGRFLLAACAAYPDRIAIRFEGRSVTYRELAAEVRRLSQSLVGVGLVKGARVALCMGNRPEWIAAAFAVALVGGVAVPLSTFATPGERDYLLRHSDAAWLLLQRSLRGRDFLAEILAAYPETAGATPGRLRVSALPELRRVFCLGMSERRGGVETWDHLGAQGGEVPTQLVDALAREVTPADDALILYTSGTSEKPKAVLHRHLAPVVQSLHFARSMALTEEDRLWTAQPFFWAAGIAVSLGATLAAGARLILQETFDAATALDLIERERATVIRAWPHQEKAMAEHPSAPGRDLGSVKKLNFTSPLAGLVGLKRDEWGTQGGYGLSETFTVVADLPADAPAELRRSTSGRPLAGMEVRIVDPETGAACKPGEPGEIVVKGITLMRGYYKVQPGVTFDPDGFFHTRDAGFLDSDGYLHWTGRLSAVIKSGGANVSPLEVERALAGYPGVAAAFCVGVPHPVLGQVVVLCAVASAGADLGEGDAIRGFLRERLSAYKVPRRVLWFRPEEIPITGTEKVRTSVLQQAALRRLQELQVEIEGVRYGGGQ